MRPRLLLAFSALSLLLPAAATAAEAEWAPAFAEVVGAGRLGEAELAVMVVAGGVAHPELERARAALVQALLDAGVAAAVLDDSAVGSLLGLDDAAVLERLRGQPAERFVIVRVYSGPRGKPPSALVTVYGSDGGLIEALRVQASGGALELRDPASEPGEPLLRHPPLRTVASAERRAAPSDEEMTALYPEWITFGALDAYRYPIPLVGAERRPLPGAEAYEALGRSDLADEYRTREGARNAARAVGIVAGGSGALLFVGGLYVGPIAAVFIAGTLGPQAVLPVIGGAIVTGAALLVVGGLVGGIAGFVNPHPLTREEIRALVEKRNRALLKPADAPPPTEEHDVE